MAKKLFSQEMSDWLKSKGTKTFGDLEIVFKEKSFAVAFLLLMSPAALPIPTGGITHVFEIITMLIALELIAGRKDIWIPKFFRRRNLGNILEKKALPKLTKMVAWFEKHSHKRFQSLATNRWYLRVIGLFVFLLALAAFLAVPFSGLDTIPALGIVIIALSLILDDILIMIAGLIIGIVGVAVELSLGAAALHFLNR